MKKKNLSTIIALLLLPAHVPVASAARRAQATQQPARQQQQPTPTPQPSPALRQGDEDVVRITSNLVQFDAIVTDKQGRLVTDLRPEDFDVFIDGKRQEITNFSFVSNETVTIAERPAAHGDKTATPPPPPVPLRASQVRRTIALVADDLGTSFEDIVYVRRALKKFVDEQMQPGDLVAIMRTSAGIGALQQFTTDKQLLYRAIEHVRWNPQGRAGVSAFAPIEQAPLKQTSPFGANAPGSGRPGGRNGGSGSDDNSGSEERDPSAELEDFRQGIFTVGTLGALNFIVRGMRELPGRKSVVVFSDGFSITQDPKNSKDTRNTERILENLRRLTDLANRASVIIYTMDARGLPTLGLTAADQVNPTGGGPVSDGLDARRDEYLNNQEGLAYLARQTGGLFIRNTNDLGGGVRRVLEDQKGYYLIGFRPGEGVFDSLKGRARFNKLEVKVRREGTRLRTRAGFYNYTEEQFKPTTPRTRSEQIMAAITSPLTSGELSLRLTSLFNSPSEKNGVVDSLLHIDMSQVKFTDDADGWKKAVIDVVAIIFGENGQVVNEINRTETVRAREDMFRRILSEGLVYIMKVPVKKPGAYQLRVAVRDAVTEKLGSASQFIEVPDLKKDRLALSGIFMMEPESSAALRQQPPASATTKREGGDASATVDGVNPLRDATVRRFRAGTQVNCLYDIYNARIDPNTSRPQLQTQALVFRDGRPIFTGPVQTFDATGQTDMLHLRGGAALMLGAGFAPGDYVLQVIVNDTLVKGNNRTATQWIDFEVVK
jgi:VWFA-related protein